MGLREGLLCAALATAFAALGGCALDGSDLDDVYALSAPANPRLDAGNRGSLVMSVDLVTDATQYVFELWNKQRSTDAWVFYTSYRLDASQLAADAERASYQFWPSSGYVFKWQATASGAEGDSPPTALRFFSTHDDCVIADPASEAITDLGGCPYESATTNDGSAPGNPRSEAVGGGAWQLLVDEVTDATEYEFLISYMRTSEPGTWKEYYNYSTTQSTVVFSPMAGYIYSWQARAWTAPEAGPAGRTELSTVAYLSTHASCAIDAAGTVTQVADQPACPYLAE